MTGLPGAGAGELTTIAGGLVLLYPWLEVFLDDVVGRLPDRSPIDGRRSALAAIVAGDLAALASDPLVRILAGDGVDRPPDPVPVADSTTLAGAEVVLRRFARTLPGFGDSSAEYLRSSLVLRVGAIDHLDGEWLLRLEPGPLDVLLEQLPYPLGIFRLPWTDPILVQWGEA